MTTGPWRCWRWAASPTARWSSPTCARAVSAWSCIKVTGSSFAAFARDEYTTLPERPDRMLFTFIDISWRYLDPSIAVAPDPLDTSTRSRSRTSRPWCSTSSSACPSSTWSTRSGCGCWSATRRSIEITFEAQNRTFDPAVQDEARRAPPGAHRPAAAVRAHRAHDAPRRPMTESARRALVTGGGSGLGLAIARQLVDDGARVAIADVSTDALAVAAEQLGGAAIGVACDVRSPDQVRDMVDGVVRELGGLDIVVLSAGVIHIKPLAEVTEADWDMTLDVNLKGAFLVMQAAAPHLVASGHGRIVAISSDAGKRGFSWIGAYSASKFGLIGLVESVARRAGRTRGHRERGVPGGCSLDGHGPPGAGLEGPGHRPLRGRGPGRRGAHQPRGS